MAGAMLWKPQKQGSITRRPSCESGVAQEDSPGHRRLTTIAIRRCFQTLRALLVVFGLLQLKAPVAAQSTGQAQPAVRSRCRVEATNYKGWQAQQISNLWVQLIIVPQNGGRLMQVRFNGHSYLFVNPKLAGKYMPPDPNHWYNYGGDKLWLLPEGDEDEHHWRGNSDLLDDGQFNFRNISNEQGCGVELTGPADALTGVQFTRSIHLDHDSPRIAFLASMKNVSGHTIEWSMQSVSQYDTADSIDSDHPSRDFWGFTPANRSSEYLNRYHVRFGPAENPSARIRDENLFSVHYAPLAAEFWIDTSEGWLAVVDGGTRYAMVERFHYQDRKKYPGKASVIFWTNGPHLNLKSDGVASISSESDEVPFFYMEAEINSPLCRLRPGETCQLETEWFPTRSEGEFYAVTDAGIVCKPPQILRLSSGKVRLAGSFGVFYPGKLVARFYSERGSLVQIIPLIDVSPSAIVALDTEITPTDTPARVSLHLEDQNGLDRGALLEVPISAGETR